MVLVNTSPSNLEMPRILAGSIHTLERESQLKLTRQLMPQLATLSTELPLLSTKLIAPLEIKN